MQTPSLKEKLNKIKNNMFPHAFDSIEEPEKVKWHSKAHQKNSSQVLAFDVFGTLKISKYKDEIINMISFVNDKEWNVELEYEPDKNILNEPKSSQIDVRIWTEKTELIIECKFTEKDGGACSQTKTISKGSNKGKQQCNGNYEDQINLVNNISSKCALSGKDIKYWDYIGDIYPSLDKSKTYSPCPFNSGSYQWMRNLCLVKNNLKQKKNSKFLLVYVESEKLHVSKMVEENKVFNDALPKSDLYSFLSYQEIINFGLQVSKTDINEHQIWNDLKIFFDKKVKQYI